MNLIITTTLPKIKIRLTSTKIFTRKYYMMHHHQKDPEVASEKKQEVEDEAHM